MKKFFYLLLVFNVFFGLNQVSANSITVKGYVKRVNGAAVANTEVKIAVYLANSTTTCSEQAVVTNSTGFYSKELSCVGDIRRSRISLKDCNGTVLVQEKEVPVSKIVEANFTVCQDKPATCAAKFSAELAPASSTVPAFSVKFNSSSSEVSSGDNIVHRTWDFHDGNPLLNDHIDPLHTFPHAGTYEVCLTIKTASGCESRSCKQIVIPPAASCAAKFTAEVAPASSTVPAFSVKFNSNNSEVSSGDYIVHRTWDFHDGSLLLNDRIDPLHTFPHAGSYEVCLTIKTASGCESRSCKQIVIPPAATCAAKFTAELAPASSTVPAMSERFNSSTSEVGDGDKIVHRTWDFHDGTPLLVDRVDPLHTFPHAGTYEVCLTIKTALGCESKICKQIVLQPIAVVACSAKFTFEKLGPKKFRFNSSLSGTDGDDKIIDRKWDFRDGSIGHDISPAHEFAKAGNYEVCLSIKTAKGCESRVCSTVKVEEVPSTDVALVQIVSLYPTPVHESLKIVVLSKRNNINATVAIVNADGVVLKSKKTTLVEGYNPFDVPVNYLTPGSYFIKVTTQYGIVSKPFYKL